MRKMDILIGSCVIIVTLSISYQCITTPKYLRAEIIPRLDNMYHDELKHFIATLDYKINEKVMQSCLVGDTTYIVKKGINNAHQKR